MAIVQCPQGHYYDDGKYAACPHCAAPPSGGSGGGDSKTMSFLAGDQLTRELLANLAQGGGGGRGEDSKTVGIYKKRLWGEPVVGWLVCWEGPEKGRDYRLRTGRNFVGRALKMDVAVTDDDMIARENHCSVVYDPMSNQFSLVPGDGTSTYLNEAHLDGPAALRGDDRVRIGDSVFIFIAFCGGEKKWL
ncbi:MAG: FHA domain-containing protein [Peptococcaceae bacterium]|jgi:hypothetical protein|nr:FHA domain-containing protein [Peptococcaceae bacterium]